MARPRDAHDDQLLILFLASNPETTSRLDLEEELRSIENELRSVRLRDRICLKASLAVRPDDLVRLLRQEQPTVVHFSGHGSNEGIILRTDSGYAAVTGDSLARLFRDRGVRLVVLNACFSQEQARLLVDAIDAVVGTKAELGDEAARRFSTAFYRTLGDGYSIQDAFRDGGDAVAVHSLEDVFLAYGDLEVVLTERDVPTDEVPAQAPRSLVTTADLLGEIGRLTHEEKVIFRSILKASPDVHKNVFREFFRASNRIGGNGRNGYLFRILEITRLARETVATALHQLLAVGLIEKEQLTDVLYSPTRAVLEIVNRSSGVVLLTLYSKDEIDAREVEVFFGGIYYKDGKPDLYKDMDDVPLEGPFLLNEHSDVVTYFSAGRVVTTVTSNG